LGFEGFLYAHQTKAAPPIASILAQPPSAPISRRLASGSGQITHKLQEIVESNQCRFWRYLLCKQSGSGGARRRPPN
jgi:hypothetical protein